MLVTAAVLFAAQLVQGASPHGALQAQSAGDALTEMRSSQTKALKAVLENHIHQSLANAQNAAKKTSEVAEDAVLTRKLASLDTGYLIAKHHATSACDVSPEEYGECDIECSLWTFCHGLYLCRYSSGNLLLLR